MKQGAGIVTDDLVIAMRSIHSMQNLLKKAEAEAQRGRYILNKSKITIQIINSKYQSKSAAQLLLNGNP